MKKIYVFCDNISKLFQNIKNKEQIIGSEYNLFNPNGYETFHSIYELEVNDIVALYKENNKSPYEWFKWNGITLEKTL